ncbi:hypothetical protein FHW67_000215 [Herbaspirillum sp. Sphag1AN]|uniref:hypothetical protein n=1 Tax=unclassified Herbaspirillum TaxID=2624150 RepID=UPI001611FD08|nr:MULTISPECIES: hypothetical protein [unclassified Herbaspirillum]MBB3210980.1 hypothetical protein [Herbaspirillum sp. Sphag1AN]MBB3244609.1 hypothetical protein [Herbaspirillum sp. Sphag64]
MDKQSTPPPPPVPEMVIFEVHLVNNRSQLFANNNQQLQLHIHAQKQIWMNNAFHDVPLSQNEIRSLRLIRNDTGNIHNWSSDSQRNPRFRSAEDTPPNAFIHELTSIDQDIAPVFHEQVENYQDVSSGEIFDSSDVAVPMRHQVISIWLRSSVRETASFVARMVMDGASSETRSPSARAVTIQSVAPRRIHARDLDREWRSYFDENVFWDKIYWWSLYITYLRFPPNSPPMIEGPVLTGGAFLSGRPNLRNIFQGGRRLADVVAHPTINTIWTSEIRNGFTARPENNAQPVHIRPSNQWPIRILQYYENPNDHATISREVFVSFIDVDGNTHRYRIRITGATNVDVSDA